jgi:hypothetical protein
VPGAVHDIWYEYDVDYDSVIEAVETVIEQSYRRRTAVDPEI